MADPAMFTIIGRATNAEGTVGIEARAIKVDRVEASEQEKRMAAFRQGLSENYSRWFSEPPVHVDAAMLPYFEPNDLDEEEEGGE